MKIKNGSHVTFHYELMDDKGEVLDNTFQDKPVDYIHGDGQIIEGLETLMDGEEAGFEAKAIINPEQAYGLKRQDLIVFASPENFEDNAELKVGEFVETEDPDGETIAFKITAIEEDNIFLDGNHQLADKVLHYKIEVISVN